MKNFIETVFGIFLMLITFIPMLIIAFIIKLTSKGSVLYWSDRVGKDNLLFKMPKFRTMKFNTPPMATHLFEEPSHFYTPFGRFLRRSSLDELPQLWSVIRGDMHFVGPRPALFNQEDLIKLRAQKGIDKIKPGITGWAQVNGRDELSISEKVILDEEYLKKVSWKMDIHILWLTLIKVIKKDSITH